MKKILTLLFAFSLLMACGANEEKVGLDSLFKELIAGHDMVMPLSMKQPKLKATVMEKVKELDAEDPMQAEALEIATALTESNDAMYAWMDDFAHAMNGVKDEKKKMELYEGLKVEIKEIDEATKSAIAAANKFIKE